MTRLRSLIKEALSTPPKKKDCGCGCNTCDGKKSPIITEGKIKNAISEGLKYHVDKNIPLHESVYRIGSEKHFELINEARKLWVRGLINVSEDDQAILETHLGSFGMYEGEEVPLDMPMVNEEKYYITRNLGRGQGMSLVKDKEFKSYEDAKEEADKLERGSRNMTAYFVSDKDMNRIEESLNEDEAAFEYNKARAGRIMKDLFGLDFEFDYTYKLEGDRIIIHPEGYNPDGTLFDMKDVHKEKIIRTFRDKMPKAQATPNMGGGITVRLRGFSLNEVDRYSGFTRNPEDPDSEKFEPTGAVAQFKEDLRALFGKFKDDLKNPEFIKGVAEIMVSWKSLLRSQLDEKKKAKSKKKDPPIGKPKRGGSKAYYVYVRDPKTKRIKKVSFGSGGLRAKIRNPKARKAFAARHRCSEKNDRTKASYWSCRLPRYAKQLGLGSNMNTFW